MDSSTQGNDNDETFQNDGSPQSPSRVLHLSQLPSNATEADIISLGLPFGAVTNLLMLKGRNQALLEMASEEAAVTMVNYYAPGRPFLYNQPIFIQFSNYRELNTDNLSNQPRAQAALQIVQDVQSGNLAAMSTPAAEGGPLPNQGSVLRIIVEDLNYPVTLDMLCQIFSRFGSILKIITFTKNNVFQALIQYADPVNASYAKTALDGRSIYSTCCTMRIDFSKLASLKVKYNNEKSRDFTRLDLPSGDNQLTLEQHAAPACGSSGFVPPMGFAQAAGVLVPGVPLPDIPGAVSSFAVSTPGQTTLPGAVAGQGNSVLLVSNLNPEAITPYGLFILFGLYGDVHRVKIMFKRKENALIQMADAFQAQLAISYLDGLTLYGRVLRASLSKYQVVQLPYEGQQDQGLTKDFSNSPLHRFKWPGSKNFQNIFPPSATLHLCNIPPSVTPDHLKNLFASTGSTVKALKFFQRNCRMALIQLGSVEEAAQALIELHNHCFGESHYLRISFTKSTI